LLELVEKKGISRELAYLWVQRNAMKAWETDGDFRAMVAGDSDISQALPLGFIFCPGLRECNTESLQYAFSGCLCSRSSQSCAAWPCGEAIPLLARVEVPLLLLGQGGLLCAEVGNHAQRGVGAHVPDARARSAEPRLAQESVLLREALQFVRALVQEFGELLHVDAISVVAGTAGYH